ncbi:BON domain-containing protein [Aridibaculum aurantiacum]|uniref:BON domain-containing protein n=1 Tax=Aridibaculum aurantiacum TaxID=2810307 RepID=UPI001A959459|nr:BON domain-containing protein [Aridibaculum aurantiacum]
MKGYSNKVGIRSICIAFACFLVACTNDQAIKADLTAKAKEDKNFLGVRFTVQDKVVNLTGAVPTSEGKTALVQKVEKVHGVKSVVDQLQIAPVVFGTDYMLKQNVDSILQNYPGLQAIVQDSIVVLEGTVPKDKATKVVAAIQSLQPLALESRAVVQD